MKKTNVIYLLTILISVSMLSSFTPALAKSSRFQIGSSSDCKIYELRYKGITCRNASFEDVPICPDNEDVISSIRRGKLCCCTRLKEEADDDVVEVRKF